MKITIADDFDLEKIGNSGQCFRPVNIINNTWRFILGAEVLYITPISKSEYDISTEIKTWEEIWVPYFDMNRNYSNIRKSIKNDDYLKAAADCGKGIRILKQDCWEMLITFIISQRKNIPAIRKSVELLCSKFGRNLGKDMYTGEEIYSFPEPGDLLKAGEGELNSCSLGYRTPYIIDASEKVSSGNLDLEALNDLGDDELFEALKTVKGVGDKVSNCICLFGYGRTGRAPVDVWIQKVIDQQYQGDNPFPKYKEAAGIMQQYVFYQAQVNKITSI